METPIFDQLSPDRRMLVNCFTLAEVENASVKNEPLWVPLAVVGDGREVVHALKLDEISNISVDKDGGYSFIGKTVQLVAGVLHRHEIETTVSLQGRSSTCTVVVSGGRALITFCTSVTISEVTGIFPE